MKRKPLSKTRRLRIFEAAGECCHICGQRIQVGEVWEVEHVIPLAIGGADEEWNMAPAHEHCHAGKTVDDHGRIAKAKRQKAKHYGIKRRSTKMPGGRDSKWKRKVSGETVLR